jgi:hypothetical protein
MVTLRPVTLDEAKAMVYGQEFWYHDQQGRAARIRVASQVKRWKTMPDRIEVTFKFGMYESFRLTSEQIVKEVLTEVDQ